MHFSAINKYKKYKNYSEVQIMFSQNRFSKLFDDQLELALLYFRRCTVGNARNNLHRALFIFYKPKSFQNIFF